MNMQQSSQTATPAVDSGHSRHDERGYAALYERSITDPDGFWREHGQRISWMTPYSRVRDVSYGPDEVRVRWFYDGTLNVSYNCLDRHLPNRADQTAILWEGDQPGEHRHVTYRELHLDVCRFANALRSIGVKKGDRVAIYLPMVPEAAVAMLACTRIGAVHSVVFAGFSPDALANRVQDCEAQVLVTADAGFRGGRQIPLKEYADDALRRCPSVRHCVVIKNSNHDVAWNDGRDLWYHDLIAGQSSQCDPEPMNAEDPLFILYTSGSTGKPKGVVHTTGGYLVWVSLTHQLAFDYREGEVYWCTADIGWVTGHSYIIYGPLANGATTLMFEGVPNFPDHSRFWQIVDKFGVNIFYTAPTAIRALMREGNGPVERTSRKSLRVIGTVGEPINPEAWEWYYQVVGGKRCPVVDTWWQTETGGILISPLAGCTRLKPGSATKPLFGVKPVIVDDRGEVLEGRAEGNLCLMDGGPGMFRTLYGDHQRFVQNYFSRFPGLYFTGDGARRDEDGYYWITGRVDDVINVSGHRLGTAEIESALVAHPRIAEAAVVGYPHDIKGQGICAYVILMAGEKPSETLRQELNHYVRKEIGPIAVLDRVLWSSALPKTRSGKIMRRILRRIASGEYRDLGDTSTLADATVVDALVAQSIGTFNVEGAGPGSGDRVRGSAP